MISSFKCKKNRKKNEKSQKKLKKCLRKGQKSGFDFKILTAFIRLGRAGPVGAGCPPYYYLILT